jgi:sensor domain CHASE-containing protein
MGIKLKIMISVLALFAVSVVCLYGVISKVLLNGFESLEDKYVADNCDRLQAAFVDQYKEVQMKAEDWANWDDAVQFIQKEGNDEKFIKANFINAVFEGSRLSLIAYFDLNGKLIYGREYDSTRHQQTPLSGNISRWLMAEGSPIKASKDSINGMAILPQKPFIFGVVPVTNSAGTSTAAGKVIFGRYFDQSEMKLISDKIQLRSSFALSPTDTRDPDFQQFIKSWPQKKLQILKISHKTVSGISSINDSDGKLALFYRIDLPRSIYGEALKSLQWVLIVLVIAGILWILIIYALVNKVIISRIQKICSHLKEVAATQHYDSLLQVAGRDEISHLTESINGLLAAESTIMESVSADPS